MVGNIIFYDFFAVFDLSPLTLWITCVSFSYHNNYGANKRSATST